MPARVFDNAKRYSNRPAYYVKRGGAWQPTTWAGYADEVRRAGKALMALGVGRGDTVGILGFNRPEWVIADVACMAIGGAPAGIYTTCSPPEVAYIARHAEAPVVFVENRGQYDKVAARRDELPDLRWIVTFRDAEAIDDDQVLSWDEFLARGDAVDDAAFFAELDALEPKGLATLIYTSGTTGPPKGVMLSHENLAWTADCLRTINGGTPDDVGLSYLPLSHIAEQMMTIHGPATTGSCVYYAESIDKVADNLREVRPTAIFGVPRIWEKIHAGIAAKLDQATGVKAALVRWARGVGTRANALRMRGREPSGLLALQYALANRLVFAKLKQAIGLDRGRSFVSGAAPIGRDVLEFFASLDIVIQEVYGQSEDCGPTTLNLPGRTKLGTVGPPIPGVDVRIADDGEILVRGPNVFLGYYKDPDATAEVLEDGWLHSGDLGALDADGFLTITGRKKDIIITSGGKNIAPKNIEEAIKTCPLVSEAVVIGDQRKYLTALVTLDEEAARRFCDERGLNSVPLHEQPAIRAEIQSVVDAMNRDLAKVETIKKFAILPRNLTVDDGELTPTLKVKRRIVNKNWADVIESLYAE
ncbi:MAG: long-chain fatty acid--CoA ligase [Deltaproteobacteria bacterium]|nr:MAG: long-chain fatty acid--CoA ligase [Deltaproteobacteria bacterium]